MEPWTLDRFILIPVLTFPQCGLFSAERNKKLQNMKCHKLINQNEYT